MSLAEMARTSFMVFFPIRMFALVVFIDLRELNVWTDCFRNHSGSLLTVSIPWPMTRPQEPAFLVGELRLQYCNKCSQEVLMPSQVRTALEMPVDNETLDEAEACSEESKVSIREQTGC